MRIGGWFPWDERREARKIGIKPRRGHGWLGQHRLVAFSLQLGPAEKRLRPD